MHTTITKTQRSRGLPPLCLAPHRPNLLCLLRALARNMLLVSSIAGYTPLEDLGVYSVSKTALFGLTKVLAEELGPAGVRVNCLAPGIIRTKFSKVVRLLIRACCVSMGVYCLPASPSFSWASPISSLPFPHICPTALEATSTSSVAADTPCLCPFASPSCMRVERARSC